MLVIVEGGLVDALCAEPAIDALCRKRTSASLTAASAFADVFVGHPGLSGILYPDVEESPGGFDEVLTISACAAATPPSERVDHAVAALGVALERTVPRLYLTSMDVIRAERLTPQRQDAPVVGLFLCTVTDPAARQRWDALCRTLHEQWDAETVLLAGPAEDVCVRRDLSGRLMPREIAAALSRCTAWAGDDPMYAMLARAVDAPGVFVSDTAILEASPTLRVCPTTATAQELFDAMESMRGKSKTVKNDQ